MDHSHEVQRRMDGFTVTDPRRPFRVLGVQQIALGGSKRALAALWVDLLDVPNIGSFQSEAENVDEDILRCGHGPMAIEIDLMEPLDHSRKPRVDVPPLNHIGLWVDDLAAAVRWLSMRGLHFAPGGIRKGAGNRDVCFIHPKSNAEFPISGEGVLIELVQAPPDVIAACRATAMKGDAS